jgi:hypothetical protein
MSTQKGRGIALLESAAWLVMITGLLYAIAILNAELNKMAAAERVLTGLSVDSPEKLWSLSSDGEVAFRDEAVADTRMRLRQKLSAALNDHFFDRNKGGIVCSYESDIDPISGDLTATVRRICQSIGSGDSLVDQLDIKFRRFAAVRPFPGAKTVTSSHGGEYFPRSVVFGVAVSLEPIGDEQHRGEAVQATRLIVPTNGVQLQ